MATIPSSSLQLPNPFPLSSTAPKFHAPPKPRLSFTTTTRATDPDSLDSSEPSGSESTDAFEERLNQVRIRYRSGTGKKAELRKTRKKGGSSSSSSSSSGSSGSVFLPPVPLKEPVSGGLKVDFGFGPYSERVNGWVAIVGLSALISVELATGKSVINYHTPAIVFIQMYFVAAVTALYVKYEKEKVSVWPQSSPKE